MAAKNSYTREQLLDVLGESCQLTRSVRKSLFGLNIWCPAAVRRAREAPAGLLRRLGRIESGSDDVSGMSIGTRTLETGSDDVTGPDITGATKTTTTRITISKSSHLVFATYNVNSLGNKFGSVAEFITDNNLDILTVTESRHGHSDDVAVRRSVPPGYRAVDVPRPLEPWRSSSDVQHGGGVVIYFRDHFKVRKLDVIADQKTFEHACLSISTLHGPVVVAVVYRPPETPFYDEFSAFLESLVTFNSQLIIAGDLNVHFEFPENPGVERVCRLLDSFGLVQHVTEPTHRYGGILDVVITRSDCSVGDLRVDPPSISDHGPVVCTIPFACPASPVFITRQVRGWKRLDREAFRSALLTSPLAQSDDYYNDMDADQLFKLYEDTLHNILDSLVPVHQVVVRHGATTPWFDAECRAIKRHARMLERRYRRTRDPDDRLAWVNALRAKHTSFKEKENRYWEATIKSNDKKPKVLWRTVSTILGKPSNQCHSAPSFTATDFLSFANQKVDTVRAATAGSRPPEFTHTECVLGSFEECSRQTVEKIIRNSASKSCDLDPAPTFLIKEFLGELLPFLTRMCNASIRQGHLPVSQKEAIVTPILKKSDLDPSDVKNYRPISNLPFMSKVVEKVVLGQLSVHLSVNDLFPKFQSGFRRGHSTESALLRVMSDIYAAIDTGKVSLLALLDVSAAFDTVDHSILLERLSKSYGLTGSAHGWFESFISERRQTVRFGGTTAPTTLVRFGIPQGSVLGPVLYILYTADVASLVESFGLRVHLYADDTQLYGFSSPDDSAALADLIRRAIDSVSEWMASNRLLLNGDKTQYIWFGTKQQLGKRDVQRLTDISPALTSTSVVRNLGVLLDSELTMVNHVTKLCQVCFFQLRRLRAVRRSLTPDVTLTLVHAFVCSRIDYCNSALYGVAASTLDRLQSILNAAARLILRVPKYGHISAAIRDRLHWLPVRRRIEFRICMLVRNSLSRTAPAYLMDLCLPSSSVPGRRHLRSAGKGDLVVPSFRRVRSGRRGFSVAGPCCWNSLPPTIRCLADQPETFKKALKTYFMQQY